jgi:ring-1,2-phenylacetyl-CoA epoxidase subunit PaaC
VRSAVALYALARADDALVLGHRLSEWCGRGPMLEEDMALANIGLDLIGQARSLYQYAAELAADGSTEDSLAYLRDAPSYRNLLLVELPNGDFAHTIVRQFLYSAFADPYWRAMMRSADPILSAIAAKSEKETAYHLRHTSEWVIRLGDGTAESARRARAALDALWPYTGEMFEADATGPELVAQGVAVDPDTLRPIVRRTVSAVLGEALLPVPPEGAMRSGGRAGAHSEHLVALLADMQALQRAHPGATW